MILVLVEHDGGRIDRLSLQALGLARQLADRLDRPLEAVALGAGADGLGQAAGAVGMATLHAAPLADVEGYAPAAWGAALADLVVRLGPEAVVGPGSEKGHEVLAHAAARTGLPMAANVVEVEPGERWSVTRQRWAGSLLEEAWLDGSPRLLTVAANAVEGVSPVAAAAVAEVRSFEPTLAAADTRVRVVRPERPETSGVSLTDARVVVGGGRGVGSGEAFAELEELAGLLRGAVGVSRAVTSAGWRPHAEQIGQTGLRIAPDLYIACGISGAIQHIVGCKGAKTILAINSDPDAPIMAQADYAVIGDLHAIVPAISAELRRATGG